MFRHCPVFRGAAGDGFRLGFCQKCRPFKNPKNSSVPKIRLLEPKNSSLHTIKYIVHIFHINFSSYFFAKKVLLSSRVRHGILFAIKKKREIEKGKKKNFTSFLLSKSIICYQKDERGAARGSCRNRCEKVFPKSVWTSPRGELDIDGIPACADYRSSGRETRS